MHHHRDDMEAGAGSLAEGVAVAVVEIGVALPAEADLDVMRAVAGLILHVGAEKFLIEIVPVADDAADLACVVAGDAPQIGLPVFRFPGDALE